MGASGQEMLLKYVNVSDSVVLWAFVEGEKPAALMSSSAEQKIASTGLLPLACVSGTI